MAANQPLAGVKRQRRENGAKARKQHQENCEKKALAARISNAAGRRNL
jgi:hypothetical protein